MSSYDSYEPAASNYNNYHGHHGNGGGGGVDVQDGAEEVDLQTQMNELDLYIEQLQGFEPKGRFIFLTERQFEDVKLLYYLLHFPCACWQKSSKCSTVALPLNLTCVRTRLDFALRFISTTKKFHG